jgi:3',5'-cyclic AMP phosphodiesterase CpdA
LKMLRILHLSDLHFGKLLPHQVAAGKSTSAHQFARGGEPAPLELAKILLRDITQPDAVVVSGDIGWSGVKADYDYAQQFFAHLRSVWKQVPLVVAPGNHDVDRMRIDGRQDDFLAFVRELHTINFTERYPLLDADAVNRQMLIGFELVRASQGSDELLIVTANSAAHLEDKSVPIFIGAEALQAIEDRISRMDIPARALRMFVLHHHLLPFAESYSSGAVDPNEVKDRPDESLVWNSAKLQGWLAHNSFHLVLHGHKHLSHGREDALWRQGRGEGAARRIFVVGAGSAGVEDGRRERGEPLSYNLISAMRVSERRWNIEVSVRHVDERSAVAKGELLYSYQATVGSPAAEAPWIFQAERMDDCHQAIQNACDGKGAITPFMSTVEIPEYFHPPTVRIGKEAIKDEGRIRASFRLLHPEYDATNGWADVSKLDDALQKPNPRFRFRHGHRMFAHPGRTSAGRREADLWETRPILRAVRSLNSASESKAYVGLYNPEVDALWLDEPLPGLMSVQFLRRSPNYLDIIATFRKLDLSFWWAVNMYEMGELLRWAAKAEGKKLVPGRITLFAALAEWSQDPEPAFVARLDALELRELSALAQGAHAGAAQRLVLEELLVEKRSLLSDTNLEPVGLENLAQLIDGLRPERGADALPEPLSTKIADAATSIRRALRASSRGRRGTSWPGCTACGAQLSAQAACRPRRARRPS